MNHRIAKMVFNRNVLFMTNGLSLDLMKEVFSFLPQDSRIMGFGADTSTFVDSIFITSDSFDEIGEAQAIPELWVFFTTNSQDQVRCTSIDFSQAMKKTKCSHNWKQHHGFSSTYEECTMCKEVKK